MNAKLETPVVVAITDTGSTKLPQSHRAILELVGSLVQSGADLGERDLHSAIDPSPICIVVMVVGVIVVALFVVTVVWNVWGVLMTGGPVVTYASKSGVNVRLELPSARAVSVPPELYMTELSVIVLSVLVGALLAIK